MGTSLLHIHVLPDATGDVLYVGSSHGLVVRAVIGLCATSPNKRSLVVTERASDLNLPLCSNKVDMLCRWQTSFDPSASAGLIICGVNRIGKYVHFFYTLWLAKR